MSCSKRLRKKLHKIFEEITQSNAFIMAEVRGEEALSLVAVSNKINK